jgi:DNA-binding transcriptional MerR regulator
MMKARKDDHSEGFEEVFIGPDEPLYTTGVVCRILQIPIWTLKQLDKEGIVRPERKHEGESRLYSKRQLKMVEECWYFMKQRRVKIHGLKVILEIQQGVFRREDVE